VFSRPEIKPFLHELAEDAARQGTLYLGWLTCGEDIVACHMGFIEGGILHLYHTTYDAGFGAYSPGNILMIETIKAAIDAGLRELDFMRGDESYKQRFASGTRALTAFVVGGSLIGNISVMLRMAQKKQPIPAAEDSENQDAQNK
jgi:CelD/BcsL family acetyltransferase involved in cellulose biosynthesis